MASLLSTKDHAVSKQKLRSVFFKLIGLILIALLGVSIKAYVELDKYQAYTEKAKAYTEAEAKAQENSRK